MKSLKIPKGNQNPYIEEEKNNNNDQKKNVQTTIYKTYT